MSSDTMNWGAVVMASTDVDGVVSTHRLLAVLSTDTSVAAIKPAGVLVVPTDNSPPVPDDSEADEEADGDTDADGLALALGL